MSSTAQKPAPLVPGLWAIVGFLVCVELASGVLQGYYTPIFTDIADHLGIQDADVNWFEAAQLIVSALVVPLLARLGDIIGHRNVLLISTAVTAFGSWILAFSPSFTTFLIGWALQGAYVVWLPLEVAIIHRRTADSGAQTRLTRKAAAFLVAALELGVIVGALTSGALVESTSMTFLLALPAIVVTACFFVIWFGIEDVRGESTGGIDYAGLAAITAVLGLVMGGLIAIRLQGADSLLAWGLIIAGLVALVPFGRLEAAQAEPLVDVRLLGQPAQWPIQFTAFLFGMSVLGAQIPLSTFARTDPEVGYGLGADAGFVSTLIGLYVVSLVVGALTLPLLARLAGARGALIIGCLFVALGYALWLPLHDTTGQALINMAVAGLGSGVLVAALPAAAAAAAPSDRTGFATGMTNATKTVGGAIASAVFAIALAATGSIDGPAEGHAPLSGYLTVWGVCAGAALVAAIALLLLPKDALDDTAVSDDPVADGLVPEDGTQGVLPR
ncbi:MFS family permease [Nocardioides daedukensis]|uniref:MFS family permease n=1 Tax=Nocardioides daedukensis TaxID=634462 RepID=A0A7Y9UP27_9ACTN|nr:MFS transporter [Nocardioides daedukensis]NYG59158.1 MFS family permease [Nocardioides daedukensis]